MVYGTFVCPICWSANVSCGKTADWIRMPFGVVRGVGRGIVEGEGAVLGVYLERPIVTNGAFATRSSQITFEDLLM